MRMQSRKGKEDPEINLIPLIDVSLLLVIFFMLSSTFMQEGRLKIELPQASLAPTGKQKTDPIVVVGDAERQLPRQRPRAHQLFTRHAARGHLEVAGADRDKPVTVRADGRATHQSVVSAMDVLGKLGFVRINIATVEESTSREMNTPSAAAPQMPRKCIAVC